MDDQLSLKLIQHLINILINISEPKYFLGIIDYRVLPVFAVLASLFIALFVPWFSERLRRKPDKSNLMIMKAIITPHDAAYMGRLEIKNESDKRANNVEAYVDKIIEDGKEKEDFTPIPLNWTYGKLDEIKIRRDILGNQTVYLDIFHYQPLNNDIKFHLSTDIRVAAYRDLKQGKTDIKIKLYQESGQVVKITIIVNWEKGSIPEIII